MMFFKLDSRSLIQAIGNTVGKTGSSNLGKQPCSKRDNFEQKTRCWMMLS